MRCLFCIALLFEVFVVQANVNHINVEKITKDPEQLELFRFVVNNERYYSHWTPQWNADRSRVELDLRLQNAYKSFAAMPNKNVETFLLLGDIAHYLYNLEVQNFYDSAVSNYLKAKELNPTDYRADWFLALHYTQASKITEGMPLFLQLQNSQSANLPADFWGEYAWATGVANMPSHCVFAMDKERQLRGAAGIFENQMGKVIRSRLRPIDKDSSYQKQQIWSYQSGPRSVFTSRPLGVKIVIDSTWDVILPDYSKRFGAFVMHPPALKNKHGRDINYTIALLISVAEDKDQLDDFLQKFMDKFEEKKKIDFSKKYDHMITYEIKDKNMYADIGGGHLYVIGIEREMPRYPGMALEDAVAVPKGEAKKVMYYTPGGTRTRFSGKIFYAIMLDSCEDIHEGSLATLKEMFNNQIVIE